MKYLRDKFTVPMGGDKYRENYDRIFGKKKNVSWEEVCEYCKGYENTLMEECECPDED